MFQSFFMGGFECATHRRRDRTLLDVIAATRHDVHCALDYQLLADAGIRTVRDGLRWHLIEAAPGVYDWSSFLPMLHAAHRTQTQVIWDLCHWGVPVWLDPFSAEFPLRFADFATAAARLIRNERRVAGLSDLQFYCAINEISFWSWVGGDEQHFHPYGTGRGRELKRQLVAASVAAIRAVREVDPEARFVQAEPIIHIRAGKERPEDTEPAAQHTLAQYQAWDMMTGRLDPELGGSADALDIVGVNYYWNNQWVHGSGERKPPGHLSHYPLHAMLQDAWQRYGRPVVVTETGAESNSGLGWLAYICAEVRQARKAGVPVLGLCLYPVMDYPGWDDERHCHVGLIEVAADWNERSLRADMCEELALQRELLG